MGGHDSQTLLSIEAVEVGEGDVENQATRAQGRGRARNSCPDA